MNFTVFASFGHIYPETLSFDTVHVVRSFSLPNIKVLHELINTLHAVEHPRPTRDAVGTTAGALQLDR